MNREVPHTLEDFNRYGEGFLFEHLGIVFTSVEATEVIAHIELCLLYTSPSPRDS